MQLPLIASTEPSASARAYLISSALPSADPASVDLARVMASSAAAARVDPSREFQEAVLSALSAAGLELPIAGEALDGSSNADALGLGLASASAPGIASALATQRGPEASEALAQLLSSLAAAIQGGASAGVNEGERPIGPDGLPLPPSLSQIDASLPPSSASATALGAPLGAQEPEPALPQARDATALPTSIPLPLAEQASASAPAFPRVGEPTAPLIPPAALPALDANASILADALAAVDERAQSAARALDPLDPRAPAGIERQLIAANLESQAIQARTRLSVGDPVAFDPIAASLTPQALALRDARLGLPAIPAGLTPGAASLDAADALRAAIAEQAGQRARLLEQSRDASAVATPAREVGAQRVESLAPPIDANAQASLGAGRVQAQSAAVRASARDALPQGPIDPLPNAASAAASALVAASAAAAQSAASAAARGLQADIEELEVRAVARAYGLEPTAQGYSDPIAGASLQALIAQITSGEGWASPALARLQTDFTALTRAMGQGGALGERASLRDFLENLRGQGQALESGVPAGALLSEDA